MKPTVPRVVEPVKPEAKQSILRTIRGKVSRAVDRVLGWLGVPSKQSSFEKFDNKTEQDTYYGSPQDKEKLIDRRLNRREAMLKIAHSISKCCGGDEEKSLNLERITREKADNLSDAEFQLLLHTMTSKRFTHDFTKDGNYKGSSRAGFYHERPDYLGVKVDLWNTKRIQKHVCDNENIDVYTLGHELGHAADWLAGDPYNANMIKIIGIKTVNHTWEDRIPVTQNAYTKLHDAAMEDINIFLYQATDCDTSNLDITVPNELLRTKYHSYLNNIKDKLSGEEQLAVSILTDILGIYSHGALLPPSGFSSHKKQIEEFSKDELKKDPQILVKLGSSELFASLFGIKFMGNSNTSQNIDNLFPSVKKEYKDIIDKIAKNINKLR